MPIIISFYVSEQGLACLGVRCPLMDELDLERMEEAFHRGVVVAVFGTAHRRRCAERGKLIDIGSSSILRSAIGVMDKARRGSLPLRGHHQRRQRQLVAHVVAHRPAYDLPSRQIEYGG